VDIFTYVIKRLGAVLVSLLVLSVIVFLLVRALPGSPAESMLGLRATPRLVAEINHNLGLDRPLAVQYLDWLSRAVRGDLGSSIATSGTGGVSYHPVAQTIGKGLVVTAWLSGLGIVVATVAGLALGLLGATRKRGGADAALSGVALLGLSLPDFYLGFLLILLFTVQLAWLPSVGFVNPLEDPAGGLSSLVLPVLTVGLINMASIARITRSSVLETMNRDFVTLAAAHGVPRRVILGKHVLRNALVPILTVIGLQFGFLFGGVIVIETVFGLPGMGRFLVIAVQQRDYPTIQGLVMTFAFAFLLVNLVVDVGYALIDPRIRVR
jgi:peptide/nickel transport system permease protein